MDEDGNFLMEEFEKLLTDKTKIVAITQMSNAIGTIVPVKDVIKKAHAAGAKVLVDASQSAVHMPIDVQDLDVDFLAITGHKLYGPSGIGALYGKAELLDAMPPFMGGGEMIKDVTLDGVSYGEAPHKFEAGTPPIVQAIGLGVALDYMDSIGRDKIAAHEETLRAYAHETLGSINALRIFGNARDKGAIISFELEGIHAHDVSMVIDRAGVAVRAGHPLCSTVDDPIWRDLYMSGIVWSLQHQSRNRHSCRGASQGAGILLVSLQPRVFFIGVAKV